MINDTFNDMSNDMSSGMFYNMPNDKANDMYNDTFEDACVLTHYCWWLDCTVMPWYSPPAAVWNSMSSSLSPRRPG